MAPRGGTAGAAQGPDGLQLHPIRAHGLDPAGKTSGVCCRRAMGQGRAVSPSRTFAYEGIRVFNIYAKNDNEMRLART